MAESSPYDQTEQPLTQPLTEIEKAELSAACQHHLNAKGMLLLRRLLFSESCLRELLADEVAENLKRAEYLGFWKDVEAGMSYVDAEAALFSRLRDGLREIIAINSEDDGTFRRRGGTRRGLSIVVAETALAEGR